MLPTEVVFMSRPGAFRVHVGLCHDPDCPCADINCTLTRLPSPQRRNEEPVSIRLQIDPMTWQEVDPPKRSEAEQAIVAEFLRDYPESEREVAREHARAKARIPESIREYRMSARDCEEGNLLFYSQVLSYPDRSFDACAKWMMTFRYRGAEYLIDDHYCANPACQCNDVHLLFLRTTGEDMHGEGIMEPYFRAVASFQGPVELEDVAPETRKTAKRILSAFWKEHGAGELERFKKRYACCKEIGRRSGMGQKRTLRLPLPPATEPIIAPTTRVGRNEPCPCGSGKKYKRCCGALPSAEER